LTSQLQHHYPPSAWSESGGGSPIWGSPIVGSPNSGSPNGAKIERAKSAEIASKFGSTLGAPPGELGAKIEKWIHPIRISHHLWTIWCKNQIDIY